MAITKTTQYTTNPESIPVETYTGAQGLGSSLNSRVIFVRSESDLGTIPENVALDGVVACLNGTSYQYRQGSGWEVVNEILLTSLSADNIRDGSVDASDAFDAALQVFEYTGSSVVIPSGEYRVTRTISWPRGTSFFDNDRGLLIRGAGPTSTIINFEPTGADTVCFDFKGTSEDRKKVYLKDFSIRTSSYSDSYIGIDLEYNQGNTYVKDVHGVFLGTLLKIRTNWLIYTQGVSSYKCGYGIDAIGNNLTFYSGHHVVPIHAGISASGTVITIVSPNIEQSADNVAGKAIPEVQEGHGIWFKGGRNLTIINPYIESIFGNCLRVDGDWVGIQLLNGRWMKDYYDVNEDIYIENAPLGDVSWMNITGIQANSVRIPGTAGEGVSWFSEKMCDGRNGNIEYTNALPAVVESRTGSVSASIESNADYSIRAVSSETTASGVPNYSAEYIGANFNQPYQLFLRDGTVALSHVVTPSGNVRTLKNSQTDWGTEDNRISEIVNSSGSQKYYKSTFWDGAWDSSHLVLGTHHIWVDSGGVLRIKNGEPASDTDGSAVALQV